jgi:hypothetical protein
VDHRVHPPEIVHLLGDKPRLLYVCEITDNGGHTPIDEVLQGREAAAVSRVHDDFVSVLEERLRRLSSEAVSRAGDEDARHRAV